MASPASKTYIYDAALAALVGVIGALTLVAASDPDVSGPDIADYSRPVGVGLAVAVVAPLVFRRRFPLSVLATVTAALAALHLLRIPEVHGSAIAFYVAFYSAGAHGRSRAGRQWVRVASALTIAALVVWEVLDTAEDVPDASFTILVAIGASLNVIYLAAAWFMGDLVRNRRRRETELEDAAEELRAIQAERARQAVLEERLRIARELHDVLAHHVSVMGVQAGAARRVLGSRPGEVPGLLRTIEASSREAVVELQRILGLLRREGDGVDRVDGVDGVDAIDGGRPVSSPQPGIARLGELVTDMNEAGLRVALHADEVGAVPPLVDLSTFRIVQEALTNTLKHAGPGTSVEVRLCRRDAAIEVIVEDDGAARLPAGTNGSGNGSGNGTGNGIIGMRERVGLSGGELRIGPRAHRQGWEVRAWIPT